MNLYPKVNVVVVCWNALQYTICTLDSLFKTVDIDIYLTIIDNGSDNDTRNYLSTLRVPAFVKNISYIRNEKNLGIGAAYNQGFFQSIVIGCEYTVFCNNDLFFSESWLSNMLEFMRDNRDVALLNPLRPSCNDYFDDNRHTTMDKLLGVKNRNPDEELREFISPYISFEDFCKKTCLTNISIFGAFRYVDFPDSLSSCICMARMSILKKYNYFANRLFSQYGSEDIDLCWTILRDGYKCAILNNTYVHHFRHKSVKDNDLDYTASLKYTNTILYNKWKQDILSYIKTGKKNKMIPNPDWILNKILENKYEE
mgnify:CR=1 FL=1